MPLILYISVPARYKATVQNFASKHPELCMSKLMVQLLLKYIETGDPELLLEKNIMPLREPDIQGCRQFLLEEMIRRKNGISHIDGPAVLSVGLHTSRKTATDRWKLIYSAPREFGFYISGGYLMPSIDSVEDHLDNTGVKVNAVRTSQ